MDPFLWERAWMRTYVFERREREEVTAMSEEAAREIMVTEYGYDNDDWTLVNVRDA